ncbi:hypothetical protein BV25DRAFT_1828494 [Artomyces pyxidatus]|uniref:Uncharacterized protein n=1 Tax=Artomyces pyxidatus TaxID=48021 RepID=A0ACB8SUD3_9AGAM|nr:hypothetical protein BV25DRAFT_1828494 [Artomyces pyxidatus]
MHLLLLFVYASSMHLVGSSPAASPTLTDRTILFALASTSAPDACTDISICRTRYTIIWSSLVTILACVWTAVHRNVPGPPNPDASRIRQVVRRTLEMLKIVVVTLLVPEWVLAWAVRQFLTARDVGKELERARATATVKWDSTHDSELPPGSTMKREMGDRSVTTASTEKQALLRAENETKLNAMADGSERKSETGKRLAFDEWTVAMSKQIGRLSGKWTTRHGFFVTMGGFHYYKNGKPQHPLSRKDVVDLVKSGDLVPPTEDEIRGWSQGDALSKALAVVQTLWFIVQAIARRVEGLPITQLEVMTLAYTTITVVMYAMWWDKPQNVSSPVRVAVEDPELPETKSVNKHEGYIKRMFYVIVGGQDEFVDLRNERCVPTFYSGRYEEDDNDLYADLIALAAAMVFGAVHCAAWNYAFPSSAEKIIWRVSSLAIVALPAAMFAPMLLGATGLIPEDVLRGMGVFIFLLAAPTYVAARLLLLALSFTTLRSLPSEAYQAVQWTLLVPHFS